MGLLGSVILIVAIATLVVQIIALSIPYWYRNETKSSQTSIELITTTYSGLWTSCTVTEVASNKPVCTAFIDFDVTQYTSALKATLAMEFIGTVLLAAFVVAVLLKVCCFESSSIIGKIAAGIAIAAGVFIFIGCIVYATKVKSDLEFETKDLHSGFGLCIVTGTAAVINGILCFFLA